MTEMINRDPLISYVRNDMSDNNHTNSNDSESKRYCYLCQRKDPPVETELVVDENITRHRMDTSQFTCNDCYRERMKQYRDGAKLQYAEYIAGLHEETSEELRQQWNDLAYKKLRLPERVYRVWNKYNRRLPEKGIRKPWILEVIMDDLWFIDAYGIVEEWFKRQGWSKTKQVLAKPYLIDFIQSNLSFLQQPFRNLAESRWDGIVTTIAREQAGRDKMVAQPAYIDPVTKEAIDNWFLLSRNQDQQWRAEKRERQKKKMDITTQTEAGIAALHEEELIKRQTRTAADDREVSENPSDNKDTSSSNNEEETDTTQ